ncbi:uncharacterized protein si:ch211-102c2.4 isoform X3 [Sander lucioperca]|uniref:uncharacterized protein si:ch211-102c2.4 isoform X3 n=1 Tax=Sander lucioperca TaxID=283035 RepID=UPI001653DECD|nr:uncharacterized protein si:ch211-102c2.4 isoform X3 [Sander lucioperca]
MHLWSLLLLLPAGACEAVYWQKLTCPYEGKHERLLRVWCRQSSADCCHGLAFSQRQHSVDGGHLKVTQGSESFTVALLQPSHGEGVYWCGVLSTNNTVIKLAEGYFHSSLIHCFSAVPLQPRLLTSGAGLAGFCCLCCPWRPCSPTFTPQP